MLLMEVEVPLYFYTSYKMKSKYQHNYYVNTEENFTSFNTTSLRYGKMNEIPFYV